jgi:integrase
LLVNVNVAGRLYLSDLKTKVSRETAQKRRYHLESFLLHLGGDVLCRAVKRKHIEAWLATQEVAPATLKLRFLTIRQFFDFCQVRGWIKVLPYQGITLPRQPRRQPRALTLTELRKLAVVLPDERARLIVALAVNEGLRRVEVSRLELGDLDLRGNTIRVVTAKAQTEDLIPLTGHTRDDYLIPYLNVRGRKPGALIQSERGGPLSPDAIGSLVCQWLMEAGVKEAPFDGKSLHACRHTFALNLLDHGADPTVIQAGLRHSTLGSTWTYLRGVRDVERLRPFMGHAVKEAGGAA